MECTHLHLHCTALHAYTCTGHVYVHTLVVVRLYVWHLCVCTRACTHPHRVSELVLRAVVVLVASDARLDVQGHACQARNRLIRALFIHSTKYKGTLHIKH